MSQSSKPLRVKCPHCKEEFLYYSSEFRPFCSERCRMVDLGHWLEGSYGIPAKNISEEEMAELARIVEMPDEEQ